MGRGASAALGDGVLVPADEHHRGRRRLMMPRHLEDFGLGPAVEPPIPPDR